MLYFFTVDLKFMNWMKTFYLDSSLNIIRRVKETYQLSISSTVFVEWIYQVVCVMKCRNKMKRILTRRRQRKVNNPLNHNH